ncbi:hypothetical protein F5X99DRAFT_114644 [Biscogniauxia marginata]|nr:hypothetical protein F5X99DRAFT_114644 [Biscogniauxia marginata]
MLLRQLLQRPLSRSVATAATWRPAPPAPPLPLHDSRSQQLRNYSSSPSGNDGGGGGGGNQENDSDNSPSLFEQLFPDEAKQQQKQSGRTSTWVSQLFDEPPRFPVRGEELNAHDGGNLPQTPGDEDADHHATTPLRAKSMLILSAASKYLLESDFLRLGPKGKHVEGWVGGIVRVIQARDPDTLEPLGHYFILFNHPSAARAYKEEVERLWRLGKKYIPGGHHKKDSEMRQPVPPGLVTDRGEDVASLIRSFTLILPSQRHHLILGNEQQEEKSSSSDGSGSAAAWRAEQLDQGGSFVDRLARRAGSRFLVLVAIDGGRISLETLRRTIEDDGVDRNLPWRVKGLGGDGASDSSILPFGRSIVSSPDNDPEQSLRDQGERAMGKQQEGEEGGEGSNNSILGSGIDRDKAEEHDRKYRRYPRFIVPFEDSAEAHRFVRSWHRREVVLRMAYKASGKANNVNNDKSATWEESKIINATVLW